MNIYLIILCLIIKAIILKYNNDSYLINFFVIFNISYFYSQNYKISLTISLLHLLITTFLRYMFPNKAKIICGIIFLFILFYVENIIKFITPFIELINFIGLSYVLLSTCEWLIHKYIMHCNKKSFVYNILSLIDPNKVIEDTCDKHIEHHKEVKPNMTLSKLSYKKSLFMGWQVAIYIFLFVLITLLLSRYITNIKINKYKLLLLAIILTLIWCYLWNKMHPLMHQYSGNYSIKEGPYENILNFDLIIKLFYRNHENHHLQKGNKKGNYNVVVMGADEWFGTNVIKVDNKKYCQNPEVAHEEICKK